MDCSELLCDTCVRAHQRVRLTKDHRISRFANAAITPPHTNSGGSLGSSSQVIFHNNLFLFLFIHYFYGRKRKEDNKNSL